MSDAIQINKLAAETLLIPIVGTTPLIMHNWSEKAKRQMLDSQQGKKTPKQFKDPEADYLASLYRMEFEDGRQGYGFPAVAFKAATVGAARFYGKDVKMTELRQFMFFRGVTTPADNQQLFEIEGEPNMREDMVRVGSGTSDIRYRAEFKEWRSTLRVTYVKSSLDKGSLLSLIDAGGMGVGVGEWRPEKKGDYGTYALDTEREIEVVS